MSLVHAVLQKADYNAIDFAEWHVMWLDYAGTHAHNMAQEVHQHTFDRVRSANTALRGFAAVDDAVDAKPIGFVHYYFHPSSYNLTDACTIEDLYVAPAVRDKGVGRWLIAQVAEIAKGAQAPALHWKTSTSNTTAIGLYRQLAEQAEVLTFRKAL